MKLALCLSGQPRSHKLAYQYIRHNLLNSNDVDVFIHTWKPEDPEEFGRLFSELYRNYQPKDIELEHKLPEHVGENMHVPNLSHPAYGCLSMFYSIYKSNNLRKQYELSTGTKYDFVIRSRFDFALNVSINYRTLKRDRIYISKDVEDGDSLFNDQFAISSPEIMDLYSSTYLTANHLYQTGTELCAHALLEKMMDSFSVPVERIDLDHPFIDGMFNKGRHSLIREDMQNWVDIKTWGY